MRKSVRLLIIVGVIGLLLITGSVVLITLRNQNRVYTLSGTVDLNHSQPVAASPTTSDHTPSTAITRAVLESTSITPDTQSSPLATIQPAATLVNPTAKSQPLASATPVAAAPTVPPQPALQPMSAIFYDDFTDPSSGWAPLFLDKTGNFNGYSVGSYRFDALQPNTFLYDIENYVQMDTGRYTVDINDQQSGSGIFGLWLGVQGDLNQFDTLTALSVGITAQGGVIVHRYISGKEQTIAEAPPHSITSGSHGALHLAVDASDSGMSVWVNDTMTLHIPNTHIPHGYIGMFARSNGQSLHVSFDNLLALAQSSSDRPACASIRSLFVGTAEQPPVEGDDVTILRQRLTHLGYRVKQEAQPFDRAVADAVTLFQVRNNLPPNGSIDGPGWCRLLSSAAIPADGDQTEHAEEQQMARPIPINTAALPLPLAVSVRQVDQTWRAALALPNTSELLYLELGDAFDPTWSPDGNTIAFTSNRSGRGAVWLLNLQEGTFHQLTSTDQECQFPAWSPDSSKLVVTCEPLDRVPLAARDFVIDIASGQQQQLSSEHAGWATWSSTNEIIFTHWTGKSFDLLRANPDGSSVTNLSNTDDIDEDIAEWSPDGSQIVFVANPRGKSDQRQLFTIQRDGSKMTLITTMSGPNSNPIWSPDGQTIVFSNQQGTRLQPWLLHIGASQPQQLSGNDDRIWFMNWVQPEAVK